MSEKIEREDKYLLDSVRDKQTIKEFKEKAKAYKRTGIIQWYLRREEDGEERIRLEIIPEKTGMRHVWTQAKKEHRSDLRDRLESEYSLDPTEVDLKQLETLPFVVKIRHYIEPKSEGIKEVILDEFLEKWKCGCDFLAEIETLDETKDRAVISEEAASWDFLKDLIALTKEESKKYENKKLAKNHEENSVFKVIQYVENRLKPEQVVVALQGLSFYLGHIQIPKDRELAKEVRKSFFDSTIDNIADLLIVSHNKGSINNPKLKDFVKNINQFAVEDLEGISAETDSLMLIQKEGFQVAKVEFLVFPDRDNSEEVNKDRAKKLEYRFSKIGRPAVADYLAHICRRIGVKEVEFRKIDYHAKSPESHVNVFSQIWNALNEIKDAYGEERLIMDLTGGQKYPGIIAAFFCMVNRLPFFYTMMGTQKLLRFPGLPVNWDFGSIDEALVAFKQIIKGEVESFSHLETIPQFIRQFFYPFGEEKGYVSAVPTKLIFDAYSDARSMPFGYGEDFLKLLDNDYSCTENYKNYLRKMIREVWSLQWIGDQIPETVEHSQRHSKRLMEFTVNLINTIGEENFLNGVPKRLKNEFYFVLAIAMNVHDLGHTKLTYKLGDGRILPLDSLPCVVRDLHHELSYQMLEDDNKFKLFGEKPDSCDDENTWKNIKTAVKLATKYHRGYMPISHRVDKVKDFVSIFNLDTTPLKEVVKKYFDNEDWQTLTLMVTSWLRFIDATDVQSDRTVDTNYFRARVLRTIYEIQSLGYEFERISVSKHAPRKLVAELLEKLKELREEFMASEKLNKITAKEIADIAESLEKRWVYPEIEEAIQKQNISLAADLKLLSKISFKAIQFPHFEKHNTINYVYPEHFIEKGEESGTLKLRISINAKLPRSFEFETGIVSSVEDDILKEFEKSELDTYSIKKLAFKED